MVKNRIIKRPEDYKYPSLEERRRVLKDYPNITLFGFKYKSELESLINDRLSLNEAMNCGNLYFWDNCLTNRFGILKETYIYALTNYNRGFIDDYFQCSQSEIFNRMQFEYYAEIFYYYYFSTRDVIAQIIRLYFNINIKENKLRFNEDFLGKINDVETRKIATTFLTSTRDASEFRNGFAHRFTPTLSDNRSSITEKDGKNILNLGGNRVIESKIIVENINNSVNSLFVFMQDLKKCLPGK